MTDREALLQVIASLGLTKSESANPCHVGSREFSEVANSEVPQFSSDGPAGTTITIGCGDGYGGFYFSVTFDESGKAVDHGIWE